ncbi:MAG: TraX family protein [Pseudomonadota bacterium]
MEIHSQLVDGNTLKSKQDLIVLPLLVLSDGTVEALKWLGLILMTGDHVNKYLFNSTLPVLFETGRLALPLFVFVLAYNLARPDALEFGIYRRTMIRLVVFGGFAAPAFIALGSLRFGGVWPLNIMFTLLAFTATACLVEKGRIFTAGLVFLAGGGLGEFLWPAVAFGLAIWSYRKRPSWIAAAIALIACATLWFINHNVWALAALPVILMATRFDLRVPRLRLLFYGYYPLHLALLLLIRIPMGKAGYLFFM